MSKYRIQIDRETCAGDKLCTEAAPATFALDAEGKSMVTNPQGDPPEDILAVAQGCRYQAITLYDTATGWKVWPPE